MTATKDQLIRDLKARCEKAGSQQTAADELGVSLAYVNDVLHLRREPGPTILTALGYEKIVTFKKSK